MADERELERIEQAVVESTDGSPSDILRHLDPRPSRRTLQTRLAVLIEAGRVERLGAGRATRYRKPRRVHPGRQDDDGLPEPTPGAAAAPERVRRPLAARRPVGYDLALLEGYVPNETRWLAEGDLDRLRALAPSESARQPAGTHARHILDRLLIDLSWNSSRLEGNA